MNRQEKKELLEELFNHVAKVSAELDAWEEVSGICLIECKLFNALNRMLDSYINLASYSIGDIWDFVPWYIYDNDFGKKKYEAGRKDNTKPICNVDNLLDLIEGQNE